MSSPRVIVAALLLAVCCGAVVSVSALQGLPCRSLPATQSELDLSTTPNKWWYQYDFAAAGTATTPTCDQLLNAVTADALYTGVVFSGHSCSATCANNGGDYEYSNAGADVTFTCQNGVWEATGAVCRKLCPQATPTALVARLAIPFGPNPQTGRRAQPMLPANLKFDPVLLTDSFGNDIVPTFTAADGSTFELSMTCNTMATGTAPAVTELDHAEGARCLATCQTTTGYFGDIGYFVCEDRAWLDGPKCTKGCLNSASDDAALNINTNPAGVTDACLTAVTSTDFMPAGETCVLPCATPSTMTLLNNVGNPTNLAANAVTCDPAGTGNWLNEPQCMLTAGAGTTFCAAPASGNTFNLRFANVDLVADAEDSYAGCQYPMSVGTACAPRCASGYTMTRGSTPYTCTTGTFSYGTTSGTATGPKCELLAHSCVNPASHADPSIDYTIDFVGTTGAASAACDLNTVVDDQQYRLSSVSGSNTCQARCKAGYTQTNQATTPTAAANTFTCDTTFHTISGGPVCKPNACEISNFNTIQNARYPSRDGSIDYTNGGTVTGCAKKSTDVQYEFMEPGETCKVKCAKGFKLASTATVADLTITCTAGVSYVADAAPSTVTNNGGRTAEPLCVPDDCARPPFWDEAVDYTNTGYVKLGPDGLRWTSDDELVDAADPNVFPMKSGTSPVPTPCAAGFEPDPEVYGATPGTMGTSCQAGVLVTPVCIPLNCDKLTLLDALIAAHFEVDFSDGGAASGCSYQGVAAQVTDVGPDGLVYLHDIHTMPAAGAANAHGQVNDDVRAASSRVPAMFEMPNGDLKLAHGAKCTVKCQHPLRLTSKVESQTLTCRGNKLYYPNDAGVATEYTTGATGPVCSSDCFDAPLTVRDPKTFEVTKTAADFGVDLGAIQTNGKYYLTGQTGDQADTCAENYKAPVWNAVTGKYDYHFLKGSGPPGNCVATCLAGATVDGVATAGVITYTCRTPAQAMAASAIGFVGPTACATAATDACARPDNTASTDWVTADWTTVADASGTCSDPLTTGLMAGGDTCMPICPAGEQVTPVGFGPIKCETATGLLSGAFVCDTAGAGSCDPNAASSPFMWTAMEGVDYTKQSPLVAAAVPGPCAKTNDVWTREDYLAARSVTASLTAIPTLAQIGTLKDMLLLQEGAMCGASCLPGYTLVVAESTNPFECDTDTDGVTRVKNGPKCVPNQCETLPMKKVITYEDLNNDGTSEQVIDWIVPPYVDFGNTKRDLETEPLSKSDATSCAALVDPVTGHALASGATCNAGCASGYAGISMPYQCVAGQWIGGPNCYIEDSGVGAIAASIRAEREKRNKRRRRNCREGKIRTRKSMNGYVKKERCDDMGHWVYMP